MSMSDDEIFCAALELASETQQRALVDSLCEQDREQWQRVTSLLKTHHQFNTNTQTKRPSILDQPAAVFQAFSQAAELRPGQQVGNYLLQERLGEGATSLVYKAQQLSPVKREVALKLLKPGMDSQRILARFSLEHQVIQRLEHPGITRVFEIGVQENGRPFFAMELVPNPLTITDYVNRFELDLRCRVELIIAVCEIVQHAHQRGVIHRDLKPSNILISGGPQRPAAPRIIDFGIAKVQRKDDSVEELTHLGDRFGTPAYMSPEQALLPNDSVDIRSDVYSLGVVLFELLTGSTPRSQAANASEQWSWTHERYWDYAVPLPSKLRHQRMPTSSNATAGPASSIARPAQKALGGSERELDWIVLKAIARDRELRYQTVADLQRDLQRLLRGEPVEAAGPSWIYQARKLVRRNPTLALATLTTLVTIFTSSILIASYAWRTQQAERQVRWQLDKTLESQRELLIQRDQAEAAKRQSQALLRVFQVQTATDRALGQFVKQMLETMQENPIDGRDLTELISVDSQLLTQPHERLIIRGDWSWASNRFPTEIINASFQFTSREAAKALALERSTTGPPTSSLPIADRPPKSTVREVEDRQSLQDILLTELRGILPTEDPFIAEVLDNSGLLALDRQQFSVASDLFTESLQLWSQRPEYLPQRVQTQLFLAEALLAEGEVTRATDLLQSAAQALQGLPGNSDEAARLRKLLASLQTRLTGGIPEASD